MQQKQFLGMMPILPTAILPDGTLDEKSQRRLVRYGLQSGAVAIGHFGFASEFHKISDTDRRQLIKIIVDETAGRVPVFIGVTAQGFGISINYAKEAEQLGADIIMAALPLINLPDSEAAFSFYQKLSQAVNLPIIIQDVPESANVLSPELVWRMYQEIENVKYVKAEGSNFVPKIEQIMQLSQGKLEVIGGAGGRHMIHLLRLGVTSFMTGTEALELHGAVVKAFLANEKDEAAQLYFEKILPYFMFYESYSEELLKSMLHLRGIIDHPDVIAPRAKPQMSEIEGQEFRWILDRVGLLERWEEFL